jgi:hypothetical protein
LWAELTVIFNPHLQRRAMNYPRLVLAALGGMQWTIIGIVTGLIYKPRIN